MSALVAALAAAGKLGIDPRNVDNLVYINGALVHRNQAMVSVYDAGFMLGDGVWEGVRLHHGSFLFIDDHLDRLVEGAKTIGMALPWSRAKLRGAFRQLADANRMEHNVHFRLMVTRGPKIMTDQDPRLCMDGPTMVIIAEYKDETPDDRVRPLNICSVHIRRGMPDTQDPKLNSHSKLNCIMAMLQARVAGADEALMLDPHGFVSTCNSVNFFLVRGAEVWTSTGDYCMNGITRRKTIEICRANGMTVREKNFSLSEVYGADAAFVTGTTGGQTPVASVDGRAFDGEAMHPMIREIRGWYKALKTEYAGKNRG